MTFPTNTDHGNILIRQLEMSISFQAMTDPAENFIDDTVYPALRSTKHVNTIKQTADGRIVPITNFASAAAAAAAGPTFGLIDLVSRQEACPATFYGMARMVSYWMQTPRVLNADEVYIHHVVDPNTGLLHPTLFDVNNIKANSIGKVVDFHQVNKDGRATQLVWGSYLSTYYKDMIV